jgi:hypothetical protein
MNRLISAGVYFGLALMLAASSASHAQPSPNPPITSDTGTREKTNGPKDPAAVWRGYIVTIAITEVQPAVSEEGGRVSINIEKTYDRKDVAASAITDYQTSETIVKINDISVERVLVDYDKVYGYPVYKAKIMLNLPFWQYGELSLTVVDTTTGAQSKPVTIRVEALSSFQRVAGLAVRYAGFLFVPFATLLAITSGMYIFFRTYKRRRHGLSEDRSVSVPADNELDSRAEDRDRAHAAPPPPVPPDLVKALADGQAVLVIGAEASAVAGFPTGNALLKKLLEKFSNDLPPAFARVLASPNVNAALRELTNRLGGFEKAMDALLSSVPREDVAMEIERILSETEPSSSLYDALAGMPWSNVICLVWDSLAQLAFTKSSSDVKWRALTLDDSANIVSAMRERTPLLLCPVGAVGQRSSMSLSMAEFNRNLDRAPEFKRGLGLLLQTQTFLFLGVGAETLEPFLQSVAPDQLSGSQRHFALISDDGITDVWSATLSKYGVAVLPYAKRQQGLLADFVHRLRAQYRLQQPTRERRPVGPLKPFRITGLRLTNIGLFRSLDLKLEKEPIEGGQLPWTVIFGENGCGKTTILRAIAIALCGGEANEVAQKLLRTDARDGNIELYTELSDHPFTVHLQRDGTRVRVSSTQSPVAAGVTLVLGFPSLRGAPSPNPRGPGGYAEHGPDTDDLMRLATGEVDGRMKDFKQWLLNVLVASDVNPREKKIRQLMDDIIRYLVPGNVVKLVSAGPPYEIRVIVRMLESASANDGKEPSVELKLVEVPFEELSLGVASIFNWVGVLVQRLYDVYPTSENPAQERAVVVVDEIDAHLHPGWQRKLVDLTKKFFPHVQVIATSHSALLAGSLRKPEVHILDADGTELELKFDPFGQSSAFLLTSDVFGLPVDRNEQAEELIQEYTQLFQQKERSEPEEKRLEELRQKIRPLNYAVPRPLPVITPPSPADVEALKKAAEKIGAVTGASS